MEPEPDIAVVSNGNAIRMFGVTYSLELFRKLARHWGHGSFVEIIKLGDGRIDLYRHRPGASQVPAANPPGFGDPARQP